MSGRFIKTNVGRMFVAYPGKRTKEYDAQIDMIDLTNGTPLNETHSAFIEYLAENVKDCPGVPVPFIIEKMLKTGFLRMSLVEKTK
jgi:hypothetical protein